MDVGAVGGIRRVAHAIKTAEFVLRHTGLSLLVGEQATAFALEMGVPGPTNLSSDATLAQIARWQKRGCQPNYWRHVVPDSRESCGPYRPLPGDLRGRGGSAGPGETLDEAWSGHSSSNVGYQNHDTISMVVIDKDGHMASGTSTNGLTFKIPGRVGDGPIAGASSYVDSEVGGCGATGDGDVMMRFLPCYQVVESMRRGQPPKAAAEDAISRIRRKYPSFVGALFAVNSKGEHGGACHGWVFKYSVMHPGLESVLVETVHPINVEAQ